MSRILTDEWTSPELPNEVIFMILDLAFTDLISRIREEPSSEKRITLSSQACDIACVSTTAYRSALKHLNAGQNEVLEARDRVLEPMKEHEWDSVFGTDDPGTWIEPEECGICEDIDQQYEHFNTLRDAYVKPRVSMAKAVKGSVRDEVELHEVWERAFPWSG